MTAGDLEASADAAEVDLFGDGGCLLTQTSEGTSPSRGRKPRSGDEVLVRVRTSPIEGAAAGPATAAAVQQRLRAEAFAYILGSEALGQGLSQTCDAALARMRPGDRAAVRCSPDHACGDLASGATDSSAAVLLELELERLHERLDVSLDRSRSLMKKQLREGQGWETPRDTVKVSLLVESATDGAGSALPGFKPKTLEFSVGDGDVCDAFECVVCEMRRCERAELTCSQPSLCLEGQLGLNDIAADKVIFIVELADFEKGTDTSSMSEEEKLEYATARKEVGSKLFKAGRFGLALGRYRRVVDLFGYVDNFNPEAKKQARELRKACELNSAACYLKFAAFKAAKKSCDNVLCEEADNTKALFRRAQALLALREFADAARDLKRVLERDQQNREARALLKQALAGQKEEDKKKDPMLLKMSDHIGKGPIPEPYVAPPKYPVEKDEHGNEVRAFAEELVEEMRQNTTSMNIQNDLATSHNAGQLLAHSGHPAFQTQMQTTELPNAGELEEVPGGGPPPDAPEEDEVFVENKAAWPDDSDDEDEN